MDTFIRVVSIDVLQAICDEVTYKGLQFIISKITTKSVTVACGENMKAVFPAYKHRDVLMVVMKPRYFVLFKVTRHSCVVFDKFLGHKPEINRHEYH